MNPSSDAAEQMVRLYLESLEVSVKLTGSGVKNVAAMLVAVVNNQQKVKGKTNLNSMLKSGKPLKVFSIKTDDLRTFTNEAKRYGVLFSAIVEKQSKDNLCDILVREEDAPKINRIIERFNLSTVDLARVKSEVDKIKEERSKGVEEKDKATVVKDKETNESKESINPPIREEKNQSNPSLNNKEKLEISINNKPSVREEIKKIKEEQEVKTREKNNFTKHKQIKKNKKEKQR